MNIGPFVLAFVAAFGRKMFPPVRGAITSKFGENRNTYSHNGTDIAVPVGTVVRAPFDGIVLDVFTTVRGGLSMRVISTDPIYPGWIVGFAHLQTTMAEIDESFTMGESLAMSGNSGQSTGPHLHLTVRNERGILVDPEKFIRLSL